MGLHRTALFNWLFGPTKINDAVLGTLEYSPSGWVGHTSAGLSFSVQANARILDHNLRGAILDALSDLQNLERIAREYIRNDPRADSMKVGELFAISVNRADPGWVATTLARDMYRTAVVVRPHDVILSLEFGLVGDSNMLEVIFKDRTPVTTDYH